TPPVGQPPTPVAQSPVVNKPPSPRGPLPSISPQTMQTIDMVNTAVGMTPSIPGPIGNAVALGTNAAHLYNEGMTQKNAVELGATALDMYCPPLGLARATYDGLATVTGNESYTSTALVDRGITGAMNHVNNSNLSEKEITNMTHMAFG